MLEMGVIAGDSQTGMSNVIFHEVTGQHTRLHAADSAVSESVHRIALTAASTLAAIVIGIEIDHLRGAKYALCQREDCGKSYPSRSNKTFCDYYCARLHTVRRLRAKKRRNRKHEKRAQH